MYTKKCKYCGKYHAGKARTERKEAKKEQEMVIKLRNEQIIPMLYSISYIQNNIGQTQRYIKMMYGKEYSVKEINNLFSQLRQELKIQRYE